VVQALAPFWHWYRAALPPRTQAPEIEGDLSSAHFVGKRIETVGLDPGVLAGRQFYSERSSVQPRKVPNAHYAHVGALDEPSHFLLRPLNPLN
jgi:hypothetical protein